MARKCSDKYQRREVAETPYFKILNATDTHCYTDREIPKIKGSKTDEGYTKNK